MTKRFFAKATSFIMALCLIFGSAATMPVHAAESDTDAGNVVSTIEKKRYVCFFMLKNFL